MALIPKGRLVKGPYKPICRTVPSTFEYLYVNNKSLKERVWAACSFALLQFLVKAAIFSQLDEQKG